MSLVRTEHRLPIFLRFVLTTLVTALTLGVQDPASAQPAPRSVIPDTIDRGVVWTPPSEPSTALQALKRMHDAGATAVRLTTVPGDSIVKRAGALGLRLYIDLPVSSLSTSQASQARDQPPPQLARVRSLAARYGTVTSVGVGQVLDTTSPDLCAALARWTEQVHSGAPSLRTYYVTPFRPTADRCSDAVDRVLLDLRGSPTPVQNWFAWQSKNTSVGIGALGTWVRPDPAAGLQIPHSPARQARYLERALGGLLKSDRALPPALFVFRWQDDASPLLPSRQYGLHESEGSPRPAADVMKGFFTGTQRVFAFPSGNEPKANHHILLLIGWGLLALIGGLYTQSLFVRRTVVRYFTAHGFYRDAVREGRDLHPGLNSALLGIVLAALGATAVVAARLAATRPVTERLLSGLPPDVATVVAYGIEEPTVAGIAIATFTGILVLLWMVALVGVGQRWSRFSVSQGLLIVVWPSWPALGALPVALATTPDSLFTPSLFAFYLLAGGFLSVVYYTIRVLGDYRAVTKVPWAVLLPLVGLSPLALLTLGLGTLGARYDVSLLFLWDLATKTF